ncbi:MAG: hypothetical protein ACRCXC_10560 [Legionella sp.]
MIVATDAFVSIRLDLKSGLSLDAFVVSNPEYWGFQNDQLGLKEVLEHLIARDDEAKASIESFFMTLNDMASYIVESSNFLKSLLPTLKNYSWDETDRFS